MPFANLSNRHTLQLLLVLVPMLVLLLTGHFSNNSSRISPVFENAHPRSLISYQPWNSPQPELGERWYADDGTPLSYQAWRIKDTDGLSTEPTARSTLLNYGARVACWPSNGKGVWIKRVIPLEMDFLGLSRFSDTQRSFQNSTEDAFCVKMRMIGAEFWNLPPESWDPKCANLEKCIEPQIRGHLGIVWPKGGGACIANLTEARKRWGLGLKGYHNAVLMDHMCDISHGLGGVYCPAYPELCEAMWCTQYPDYCNEAGLLY